MMKSVFSFLLCLVLLSAPVNVLASGPVIVSVEDMSVTAGERAELTVSLANNPGVSGASFTVLYDPDDIELVDIQPLAGGSFVKNLSSGSFSWLKGSDITGGFGLVKLCFETSIGAFGQYEIGLKLNGGLKGNLTNSKSEEVEVAFRGAILTVLKPSETDKPQQGGGDTGSGDSEDSETNGEDNESCQGGENCPIQYFYDLKSEAWYHEAVDFALSEGIMKGVADDSFAPAMPTSRAMIVTMLYRLAGEPEVESHSGFDDVKADRWYSDAVTWAAEAGIVKGYGEGIFGPNYLVTREQMAAIFHRWAETMGMDTSATASLEGYKDIDEVSSWALEAMEWACGVGLMEGRGTDMLSPGGSTMRSETAMLLWRWCNIATK